MEAEKQAAQEIEIIREEEIMISNEGEENEEKEEEGKTILRARKKKKNYVNYDANNYKNTNYSNNRNTNYSNNKNTNYSNNNTNYSNNKNTKTTNYNNTTTTTTKKKVIQKKDLIYDPNFDAQSNYFYQKLSDNDWIQIKSFLKRAFTEEIPTEIQLKNFFDEYPKLKRGNIEKLQESLDTVASEKKKF